MNVLPINSGQVSDSQRAVGASERLWRIRAGHLLLSSLWIATSVWCSSDTAAQELQGTCPPPAAAAPQSPGSASPPGPAPVDLISDDLTKYWKHYSSDPTVPLAGTWRVVSDGTPAEPLLICSGQPKGLLLTAEEFSNFELTLEWRFPDDANGNSGVLVYTQNESRIWPTAMQIQFHQPKAGSIFPSGEAKSENATEADLANPVNTWNTCRILSQAGRLTVDVNGRRAGEVSGAVPSTGHIALQSEGAIVHFRRIRVRRLNANSEPALPPVESEAASD